MNLRTGVFIVSAITALSLVAVTIYHMADYVMWLGLLLLVFSGLSIIYWLILSGFVATERYRDTRAKRETSEANRDESRRRALNEIVIAPERSQVFQIAFEAQSQRSYANPLHLQSGDNPASWAHFHSRNGSNVESVSQPQLTAPIPEQVYLDYYVSSPSIRNIFLGIGRFPDGQVKPVSAPLSRLVNIAVGGGSGFGKSVFLQTLAYQIINARENVQPVFLDGQGVTFTEWYGDNRLLYPIGGKPGDILAILLMLVAEMNRREDLFSQWRGVDSIEKYNSISTIETLPYIPILFDEFGICAENKKISDAAKQLSKAGRKVGMPSISADQTWLASDISTAYRGNLSTSFQFYVRSKSLSRILIGDSGAVELLRAGQCLAALPGQPGLIELQAPDPSNLISSTPVQIEAQVMPVVESSESDSDSLFVELVNSGVSRNAASKEAWGRPYAGDLVDRGRRLLGEI